MDSRAELAGLSPLEQEVLCALALAGDAEVSPAELAGLAGAEDVGWAVDELVRRGLVGLEPDDRVAVRPAWRRVVDASDRAQAILERAVVLAETGRLSPETLLGLTAWALRARRYRELLAIVQAAQQALAVVRRVEAWIELLERARAAARAVGDRDAEVWAERRLETVRAPAAGAPVHAPSQAASALRRLLVAGAVAAAGAAGLAVGLLAFDAPEVGTARPAATTVREATTFTVTEPAQVGTVTLPPTTVTEPGGIRTVTVPPVTVTEPGPTRTETETVVTTETVATTETVTVTVQPPPPPPIG